MEFEIDWIKGYDLVGEEKSKTKKTRMAAKRSSIWIGIGQLCGRYYKKTSAKEKTRENRGNCSS